VPDSGCRRCDQLGAAGVVGEVNNRLPGHGVRNVAGADETNDAPVAEALNVSTDDLVGTNGKKKRGTGPAGKMRQLFEAASRLPRSQQQKIAAVLEAFIAHNRGA